MWLVSVDSVKGNLPFKLEPGTFVVGRQKGCQIVINQRTLSRQHARLVVGKDSVTVVDLGSRNGTCVDDERAEPGVNTPAQLGSPIKFGAVECMLRSAPLSPDSRDEESTYAVHGPSGPAVKVDELTPAQQEVLRLALRGLDESAIARKLRRSGHTIHTHLKAIFRHFGVHSRPALLARFMQPRVT